MPYESGGPAAEGRLQARPEGVIESGPTGLHPLEAATERESYVYVPEGYREERPAPLVVLLHGAGGHARHGLAPLQPLADETGVILLAPASREQTWDVIVGEYGPDVALMDWALEWTFHRYAVDPARLAIGGFSDGASYALSLGLTNGDLFTHVIAFSPGFAAPAGHRGAPRIFVSHGTHDSVLPIEACSRRVVPGLRGAGYDIRYREFNGGHTVPPGIAREALDWLAGGEE